MIIKPRRRGGFKQFSDYLQGEAGNDNENEAVNFISSSTSATDINSFCMFASDLAAPTRGGRNPLKNPIEHISIRTRKGDILTPKMIKSKLPRLLKALGYQKCPWILVQHIKDGEPHYHLGICRIDKNGNIPDPLARKICKEQADIFARELGFSPAFDGPNGNRFAQQKDHLARLWIESAKLKPSERLKKFQKGGFTAARGDRGQIIFVDRYGKPHSLNRIPALKAKGLKQADFPAAFGFDTKAIVKLPDLKTAQKNIRRIHNVRRTTNKLIRAFGKVGRIYQNALSPLRRGPDLGNRGWAAGFALLTVLRRLSRISQRHELRQVRGTADRAGKLAPSAKHLNPSSASGSRPRRVLATMGWWVAGKASAVFKAVLAAGATEGEAERAAELVYIEEQQRMEAEQQYLDWLHGYEPKRTEQAADKQQPEFTR